MAENSHITWTDNTHNEWIGCTKVSAGCDNCYAERMMDQRYGRVSWGKGNARSLTSVANRRKPYAWDRQAAKEGRRIKVFTASLSDVFDEEVSDEWRDGLFETMRNTPNLDWLVLTKRLAKMLRYVGSLPPAFIPQNVWWGCSVENQATADQRVSELLKLRALVGDVPLWLSVEPLLGAVDLTNIGGRAQHDCLTGEYQNGDIEKKNTGRIDWVVVGGESGPDARPMHPDWARSLRDQCVSAGVPFHFKQWGEYLPGQNEPHQLQPSGLAHHQDGSWGGREPTSDSYVWWDEGGELHYGYLTGDDRDTHEVACWAERVGKKAAGRLLDGRTWDEFPQ